MDKACNACKTAVLEMLKNELLHQWFDKLFLWAFISIVECGTIKKSHFLTKFVFGLSIWSGREDFAKKRESKEETK